MPFFIWVSFTSVNPDFHFHPLHILYLTVIGLCGASAIYNIIFQVNFGGLPHSEQVCKVKSVETYVQVAFWIISALVLAYLIFCIYIQVLAADCTGEGCGIGEAISIILWVFLATTVALMWTQALTFMIFVSRFLKSTALQQYGAAEFANRGAPVAYYDQA